jgi:hypothetical protein
MSSKDLVEYAFNEYMIKNLSRDYDAEIWQYDAPTNQLFLTVVGKFSDEERRFMQSHIRKYVSKLLINAMVNYDELDL